MYPAFSLDQLTAFLAVVDEGSFSGAGRRLGRVQSAVSYAIGQLEAGLGTTLFDREGRTPVLTDAGRRLAAEARLVLAQATELAECAAQLERGVEPELRLVLEAVYPTARVVEVCDRFAREFPRTTLRVEVALLRDALQAVRAGEAELGVCNLAGGDVHDLSVEHLGEVRLVPVCAPGHALAKGRGTRSLAELRKATQIVLSERARSEGDDLGVLASRTWRVTDLTLKRELILGGVGWGSLPSSEVEPLIAAGRLVQLRPAPWPRGHEVSLHAVSRPGEPLGRAGQWLREELALAA